MVMCLMRKKKFGSLKFKKIQTPSLTLRNALKNKWFGIYPWQISDRLKRWKNINQKMVLIAILPRVKHYQEWRCFTHDWAYLRIYNKPPVHDQQHDVNDENCKKMNDVECIKLWPLKNQPLSLSQLLINGRFKLSLLHKKLSMETTSGVRWCDFRLRKKPVFGVYNMVNVVVDSLGERDPACLSLRFLSYFWS